MTTGNQQIINQMSLIMTIPEDIVKACKQNGLSPAMTETLLRLHNQQTEMEKAINEQRSIQMQMAQIIEKQAGLAGHMSAHIQAMGTAIGFDAEEMVSTEEIGG